MSYEIIKTIKVKDNKVYLKSACNNVSPRDYTECECKSLTDILQSKGQETLDLEVFKAYEEGNFQTRGNNKYTRALQILHHMPEYHDFDWRNNGTDYEMANQNRKNEKAFNTLLLKAFNSKLPKDKFIVTKIYGSEEVYLYKVTTRHAKWTHEKAKSKIFRYKNEAEGIKSCFCGSESWEVKQINCITGNTRKADILIDDILEYLMTIKDMLNELHNCKRSLTCNEKILREVKLSMDGTLKLIETLEKPK